MLITAVCRVRSIWSNRRFFVASSRRVLVKVEVLAREVREHGRVEVHAEGAIQREGMG